MVRAAGARRGHGPSLRTVTTESDLARAADVIRRGGLVGIPTETVYGLAADATDPVAVRRVFTAKGRPSGHPLIVHLAHAAELPAWALDVPDSALRLAAACWPGPLTLVLRRGPGIAPEATGGRATVGLRLPDHPIARRLIELAGVPLAAPSANRFGRVSPTCAQDVRAELGAHVDLVLDGGPCAVGVESTIVDLVGERPLLLRPGGVPVELVEEVLGGAVEVRDVGPARASGMLASHYAPGVAVELVAAGEVAGRAAALLGAGRRVAVLAPPGHPVPRGALVLEPPATVGDYARSLYRRLHEADEAGVDVLVAAAPPPEGLGLAVLDRLRRAAAPRD
ncbi:MAG: threonylcarbamoyl-AMP synthase [Acidimicrobiia bacterium]|nr:threonylcarbamoyl-AMP synthase [Acidimicrobiia bacterium]